MAFEFWVEYHGSEKRERGKLQLLWTKIDSLYGYGLQVKERDFTVNKVMYTREA